MSKAKAVKKAITFILICAAIIFTSYVPTTTRQGVNGVLFVKKIPLYVKVCGFLYRDDHYRTLAHNVTYGIKGDRDKVMAIYDWSIKNIRIPPKGFPIIDDHIWDIIVRGYGVDDQKADVFTTLASYAGYKAFWEKLCLEKTSESLVISFVKINNTWCMFDVYNGKCFIVGKDLLSTTPYGPTYGEYLNTLDKNVFKKEIKRSDKQKIFPRLIYEFKNIFTKNRHKKE